MNGVQSPVYAVSIEHLRRLRAAPSAVPGMRAYYCDHIARFIDDWGITADPRNALINRPVVVPFVLFPRQVEWVDWVLERARKREPGLTEKSRDCGVSWLSMATAVSLCLFNRNLTIGFASQKEDKLDRSGDPDCLFFKGRTFLETCRSSFVGARTRAATRPTSESHSPRLDPRSSGRRGRTSAVADGTRSPSSTSRPFEHGELVDASLASTTDCRMDMSSVNGMNNSFARRRHSGKVSVFTFHWRDDPRKGEAWYAKQKRDLDPVTLAAEVDIDYRASERGMLIPERVDPLCGRCPHKARDHPDRHASRGRRYRRRRHRPKRVRRTARHPRSKPCSPGPVRTATSSISVVTRVLALRRDALRHAAV